MELGPRGFFAGILPRRVLAVIAASTALAAAERAAAAPCLIFMHGKQTNTDTFTSWTAARNY
ncbi:MAG: hypothetical protein FJ144_27960 [Deltaproteobacteria bacterium]|nr:hypothetical protein [Deltaproteobacteria bacterium]